MLEAKNLSHAFDYPLFDDVSFSLLPQESMAILGVSGSGKSTLLHALSTMLKPQAGEVRLLDKEIYTLNSKALLELRRYDIGIIFQQHYLFRGFLARENLEVAALLAHSDIDELLLERLGIAHLMGQKVTELSGGQQQRISIARVLTKKPKIIFADEPTGNLDDQTAKEVIAILHAYILEHHACLVMVTHDKSVAMSCTKSYELKNQKLSVIE